MKGLKTAQLVLAVAGVLMAGGLAGAQGPGGQGMGPGFGEHRPPIERAFGGAGAFGQWWNNPMVVKQLTLTDDQRKAMDGIMQDHKMKLIDLQANLEKAEESDRSTDRQGRRGARGSGKSQCTFSSGHPHAIEAGAVEAVAGAAYGSDGARAHGRARPWRMGT